MDNKIDFYGIGAQKAGTSWVYNWLDNHPDFSLPPIKELRYFNRRPEYKDKGSLYIDNLFADNPFMRIRNAKWIKLISRQSMVAFYRHPSLHTLIWLAKYYFSNVNDAWYRSLFRNFKGITGDITPEYGTLKEKDIKKMHDLAPDAKIIFMIRNPIKRAWSNYKFKYRHSNLSKDELLNTDRIKTFIDSDNQNKKSDYLQTLENFARYFPKQNILIGFYDAIIDNPAGLMLSIADFLEANPHKLMRKNVISRKINVSARLKMPDEAREYLKNKYEKPLKEMADTLGSYCKKWYNDIYDKNLSLKAGELKPVVRFDKEII